MKLENQVVSLELAKRLKELGVKQESVCYWREYEFQGKRFLDVDFEMQFRKAHKVFQSIAAFTVAELGELCPEVIWNTVKNAGNESVKAIIFNGVLFKADTEANARAKMLVYLLENNLITP